MTPLDWTILLIYIVLIIAMSWAIGLRQKSQEDYYLGGRRMPPWQISLSIMATQVSAISLIGAPAFIVLRDRGGLVWLQYEFAIPLAMMLIMLILVPIYYRTAGVTIYEYLEKRFGSAARSTLSFIFLMSRGLGAGVALLATGIVTSVCLNWPLWETILLIGVITIVYTTFGGIRADIYSDIIQLFILWAGAIIAILVLWNALDGQALSFLREDYGRFRVYNFRATGLGDGETFAFWPMLIGGFFLYLSYYGCDQSQAQRLLTAETFHKAQKSLFINGLLRFPLVLTYCAVGILLLPFLHRHPDFVQQLQGQQPDFLIPYFLTQYMPKGLLGIFIAGIFAASMSSLDSALNSLSAATYRDFLVKLSPRLDKISDRRQVVLSRLLTIFWGIVSTGFALRMIGGSETVLELVNKIGSAFYGPILATFWLGMLVRRANEKGAIAGLITGVGVNLFLWQMYGERVSWLWWNVIGFVISLGSGFALSLFSPASSRNKVEKYLLTKRDLKFFFGNRKYYLFLFAFFLIILLICAGIEVFLKHNASL